MWFSCHIRSLRNSKYLTIYSYLKTKVDDNHKMVYQTSSFSLKPCNYHNWKNEAPLQKFQEQHLILLLLEIKRDFSSSFYSIISTYKARIRETWTMLINLIPPNYTTYGIWTLSTSKKERFFTHKYESSQLRIINNVHLSCIILTFASGLGNTTEIRKKAEKSSRKYHVQPRHTGITALKS